MEEDRRQKPCSERIGEAWERKKEEIKQALKSEKKREEFEENLLAYSKTIKHKIEFSWGGPADWLEIETDPRDGKVIRGSYHFSDWFDHAEKKLTDEELDLVETLFSYLLGSG